MKRSGPEAIFFQSPDDFRAWLAEHHADETELWVGFHRKSTGLPSMTWEESVDEALCFGWIDGVRRRVDDRRYEIRFTPRRPASHWSKKNLDSVARLTGQGRMTPAGSEAFERRSAGRSGTYSFEQSDGSPFPDELRARFEAHPAAWRHFQEQPPGYRRTLRHWVTSAKRDETRRRRLDRLIEVSARERRVDLTSPFRKEL